MSSNFRDRKNASSSHTPLSLAKADSGSVGATSSTNTPVSQLSRLSSVMHDTPSVSDAFEFPQVYARSRSPGPSDNKPHFLDEVVAVQSYIDNEMRAQESPEFAHKVVTPSSRSRQTGGDGSSLKQQDLSTPEVRRDMRSEFSPKVFESPRTLDEMSVVHEAIGQAKEQLYSLQGARGNALRERDHLRRAKIQQLYEQYVSVENSVRNTYKSLSAKLDRSARILKDVWTEKEAVRGEEESKIRLLHQSLSLSPELLVQLNKETAATYNKLVQDVISYLDQAKNAQKQRIESKTQQFENQAKQFTISDRPTSEDVREVWYGWLESRTVKIQQVNESRRTLADSIHDEFMKVELDVADLDREYERRESYQRVTADLEKFYKEALSESEELNLWSSIVDNEEKVFILKQSELIDAELSFLKKAQFELEKRQTIFLADLSEKVEKLRTIRTDITVASLQLLKTEEETESVQDLVSAIQREGEEASTFASIIALAKKENVERGQHRVAADKEQIAACAAWKEGTPASSMEGKMQVLSLDVCKQLVLELSAVYEAISHSLVQLTEIELVRKFTEKELCCLRKAHLEHKHFLYQDSLFQIKQHLGVQETIFQRVSTVLENVWKGKDASCERENSLLSNFCTSVGKRIESCQVKATIPNDLVQVWKLTLREVVALLDKSSRFKTSRSRSKRFQLQGHRDNFGVVRSLDPAAFSSSAEEWYGWLMERVARISKSTKSATAQIEHGFQELMALSSVGTDKYLSLVDLFEKETHSVLLEAKNVVDWIKLVEKEEELYITKQAEWMELEQSHLKKARSELENWISILTSTSTKQVNVLQKVREDIGLEFVGGASVEEEVNSLRELVSKIRWEGDAASQFVALLRAADKSSQKRAECRSNASIEQRAGYFVWVEGRAAAVIKDGVFSADVCNQVLDELSAVYKAITHANAQLGEVKSVREHANKELLALRQAHVHHKHFQYHDSLSQIEKYRVQQDAILQRVSAVLEDVWSKKHVLAEKESVEVSSILSILSEDIITDDDFSSLSSSSVVSGSIAMVEELLGNAKQGREERNSVKLAQLDSHGDQYSIHDSQLDSCTLSVVEEFYGWLMKESATLFSEALASKSTIDAKFLELVAGDSLSRPDYCAFLTFLDEEFQSTSRNVSNGMTWIKLLEDEENSFVSKQVELVDAELLQLAEARTELEKVFAHLAADLCDQVERLHEFRVGERVDEVELSRLEEEVRSLRDVMDKIRWDGDAAASFVSLLSIARNERSASTDRLSKAAAERKAGTAAWEDGSTASVDGKVQLLSISICKQLMEELSAVFQARRHVLAQLTEVKQAREHAEKELFCLRKAHVLHSQFLCNNALSNFRQRKTQQDILLLRIESVLEDVWRNKDSQAASDLSDLSFILGAFVAKVERCVEDGQLEESSSVDYKRMFDAVLQFFGSSMKIREERVSSKQIQFDVHFERFAITEHKIELGRDRAVDEWYGWLQDLFSEMVYQQETKFAETNGMVRDLLDLSFVSKQHYEWTIWMIEQDLALINTNEARVVDWNKMLEEEEKSFIRKQAELIEIETSFLRKARSELEKVQARFFIDLQTQLERLLRARTDIRVEIEELVKIEKGMQEVSDLVEDISWKGEEAATFLSLLSTADKQSRERDECRNCAAREHVLGISAWAEGATSSVDGKSRTLSVSVCKQLLDELSAVYQAINHASAQFSEVKLAREHAEKELYELRKAHVHFKHFQYHELLGVIEKKCGQQEVVFNRVSDLLQDVWRDRAVRAATGKADVQNMVDSFMIKYGQMDAEKTLPEACVEMCHNAVEIVQDCLENVNASQQERGLSKKRQFQAQDELFRVTEVRTTNATQPASTEWYGWLVVRHNMVISHIHEAMKQIDAEYEEFCAHLKSSTGYESMLSLIDAEVGELEEHQESYVEWIALLEDEEKSHIFEQARLVDLELSHLQKAYFQLETMQSALMTQVVEHMATLDNVRVEIRMSSDDLWKNEEGVRFVRDIVSKIRWEGEDASVFLSLLTSADKESRERESCRDIAATQQKYGLALWAEAAASSWAGKALVLSVDVCKQLLEELAAVFKAIDHATLQLKEIQLADEHAVKERNELRKAHLQHRHFQLHHSCGELKKMFQSQSAVLNRVESSICAIWLDGDASVAEDQSELVAVVKCIGSALSGFEKRSHILVLYQRLLEVISQTLLLAANARSKRNASRGEVFFGHSQRFGAIQRNLDADPLKCWYGWLVDHVDKIQREFDVCTAESLATFDYWTSIELLSHAEYQDTVDEYSRRDEQVQQHTVWMLELGSILNEDQVSISKQQELLSVERDHLRNGRTQLQKVQSRLRVDLQDTLDTLSNMRCEGSSEAEELSKTEEEVKILREIVSNLQWEGEEASVFQTLISTADDESRQRDAHRIQAVAEQEQGFASWAESNASCLSAEMPPLSKEDCASLLSELSVVYQAIDHVAAQLSELRFAREHADLELNALRKAHVRHKYFIYQHALSNVDKYRKHMEDELVKVALVLDDVWQRKHIFAAKEGSELELIFSTLRAMPLQDFSDIEVQKCTESLLLIEKYFDMNSVSMADREASKQDQFASQMTQYGVAQRPTTDSSRCVDEWYSWLIVRSNELQSKASRRSMQLAVFVSNFFRAAAVSVVQYMEVLSALDVDMQANIDDSKMFSRWHKFLESEDAVYIAKQATLVNTQLSDLKTLRSEIEKLQAFIAAHLVQQAEKLRALRASVGVDQAELLKSEENIRALHDIVDKIRWEGEDAAEFLSHLTCANTQSRERSNVQSRIAVQHKAGIAVWGEEATVSMDGKIQVLSVYVCNQLLNDLSAVYKAISHATAQINEIQAARALADKELCELRQAHVEFEYFQYHKSQMQLDKYCAEQVTILKRVSTGLEDVWHKKHENGAQMLSVALSYLSLVVDNVDALVSLGHCIASFVVDHKLLLQECSTNCELAVDYRKKRQDNLNAMLSNHQMFVESDKRVDNEEGLPSDTYDWIFSRLDTLSRSSSERGSKIDAVISEFGAEVSVALYKHVIAELEREEQLLEDDFNHIKYWMDIVAEDEANFISKQRSLVKLELLSLGKAHKGLERLQSRFSSDVVDKLDELQRSRVNAHAEKVELSKSEEEIRSLRELVNQIQWAGNQPALFASLIENADTESLERNEHHAHMQVEERAGHSVWSEGTTLVVDGNVQKLSEDVCMQLLDRLSAVLQAIIHSTALSSEVKLAREHAEKELFELRKAHIEHKHAQYHDSLSLIETHSRKQDELLHSASGVLEDVWREKDPFLVNELSTLSTILRAFVSKVEGCVESGDFDSDAASIYRHALHSVDGHLGAVRGFREERMLSRSAILDFHSKKYGSGAKITAKESEFAEWYSWLLSARAKMAGDVAVRSHACEDQYASFAARDVAARGDYETLVWQFDAEMEFALSVQSSIKEWNELLDKEGERIAHQQILANRELEEVSLAHTELIRVQELFVNDMLKALTLLSGIRSDIRSEMDEFSKSSEDCRVLRLLFAAIHWQGEQATTFLSSADKENRQRDEHSQNALGEQKASLAVWAEAATLSVEGKAQTLSVEVCKQILSELSSVYKAIGHATKQLNEVKFACEHAEKELFELRKAHVQHKHFLLHETLASVELQRSHIEATLRNISLVLEDVWSKKHSAALQESKQLARVRNFFDLQLPTASSIDASLTVRVNDLLSQAIANLSDADRLHGLRVNSKQLQFQIHCEKFGASTERSEETLYKEWFGFIELRLSANMQSVESTAMRLDGETADSLVHHVFDSERYDRLLIDLDLAIESGSQYAHQIAVWNAFLESEQKTHIAKQAELVDQEQFALQKARTDLVKLQTFLSSDLTEHVNSLLQVRSVIRGEALDLSRAEEDVRSLRDVLEKIRWDGAQFASLLASAKAESGQRDQHRANIGSEQKAGLAVWAEGATVVVDGKMQLLSVDVCKHLWEKLVAVYVAINHANAQAREVQLARNTAENELKMLRRAHVQHKHFQYHESLSQIETNRNEQAVILERVSAVLEDIWHTKDHAAEKLFAELLSFCDEFAIRVENLETLKFVDEEAMSRYNRLIFDGESALESVRKIREKRYSHKEQILLSYRNKHPRTDLSSVLLISSVVAEFFGWIHSEVLALYKACADRRDTLDVAVKSFSPSVQEYQVLLTNLEKERQVCIAGNNRVLELNRLVEEEEKSSFSKHAEWVGLELSNLKKARLELEKIQARFSADLLEFVDRLKRMRVDIRLEHVELSQSEDAVRTLRDMLSKTRLEGEDAAKFLTFVSEADKENRKLQDSTSVLNAEFALSQSIWSDERAPTALGDVFEGGVSACRCLMEELSSALGAIHHSGLLFIALKECQDHVRIELSLLRKAHIFFVNSQHALAVVTLEKYRDQQAVAMKRVSSKLEDIWRVRDSAALKQGRDLVNISVVIDAQLVSLGGSSSHALVVCYNVLLQSIRERITNDVPKLREKRMSSKDAQFVMHHAQFGAAHHADNNFVGALGDEWYGWMQQATLQVMNRVSLRKGLLSAHLLSFLALNNMDLQAYNEILQEFLEELQFIGADEKDLSKFSDVLLVEEANQITQQSELVDLEISTLKKAHGELEALQNRFVANLAEQVELLKKVRADVRAEKVDLEKIDEEALTVREIVNKIQWDGADAAVFLSLLQSAETEHRSLREHRSASAQEHKAGLASWAENRISSKPAVALSVEVCKQLLDELSSVFKAISHSVKQLSEMKLAREHAEKELYDLRKAHVEFKHFQYHESLSQIEKYRVHQDVLLRQISVVLEDVWKTRDEFCLSFATEVFDVLSVVSLRFEEMEPSQRSLVGDTAAFARAQESYDAANVCRDQRMENKNALLEIYADKYDAVFRSDAHTTLQQEWFGWLTEKMQAVNQTSMSQKMTTESKYAEFVCKNVVRRDEYEALIWFYEEDFDAIERNELRILEWNHLLEDHQKKICEQQRLLDRELAHLGTARLELEQWRDRIVSVIVEQTRRLAVSRGAVHVDEVELSKRAEEIALLRDCVSSIRWEGEGDAAASVFVSLVRSADAESAQRDECSRQAAAERSAGSAAWASESSLGDDERALTVDAVKTLLEKLSSVFQATQHATAEANQLKSAREHAEKELNELRKAHVEYRHSQYLQSLSAIEAHRAQQESLLVKMVLSLEDVWCKKELLASRSFVELSSFTSELTAQIESSLSGGSGGVISTNSLHFVEMMQSVKKSFCAASAARETLVRSRDTQLQGHAANFSAIKPPSSSSSLLDANSLRALYFGWLDTRCSALVVDNAFLELADKKMKQLHSSAASADQYESLVELLDEQQGLVDHVAIQHSFWIQFLQDQNKSFVARQVELVDLELAELHKVRVDLEQLQARFVEDLAKQLKALKQLRASVHVDELALSKSEEEVRAIRDVVSKIRWEGDAAAAFASFLGAAEKESHQRSERGVKAAAQKKASIASWAEGAASSVEGKTQQLSLDVCKALLGEMSAAQRAVDHATSQHSEVKLAREDIEQELYELRKAHVLHKHHLYHESLLQIEKHRSRQEAILQRVSGSLEDVWTKKDPAVEEEKEELFLILNSFVKRGNNSSESCAGLSRKEFAKLFSEIEATMASVEKIFSKRHQSKAKQFQGHVDRFKANHEEHDKCFARQEWYGWLETSVESLFDAMEIAEAEVDNSFNAFSLIDRAEDKPYRDLLTVLQRQLDKILKDESKIKDWTKILEEEEKTFVQKHVEWIEQEIAGLIKARSDLERVQDYFAADMVEKIESLKRMRLDARMELESVAKTDEEVRAMRDVINKIRWEGKDAAAYLALLDTAENTRKERNESIFAAEDAEKLAQQLWPVDFEIDINELVEDLSEELCELLLDRLSTVHAAVAHATEQLNELQRASKQAKKELFELRKAHVQYKHFQYCESFFQVDKYRTQQDSLVQRSKELLEEVWKQKEPKAERELSDVTTSLADFVARFERSEKKKEITEESATRNRSLLEGVRKFLYMARASGKLRYEDRARVFESHREKYAVVERPNSALCETAVEEWYGWLLHTMTSLDDALDARHNEVAHRFDQFMHAVDVEFEEYDSFLMFLDSNGDRVRKDIARIIEFNIMLDREHANIVRQQTLVDDELNNLNKAREQIDRAQAQLAADLQGDKQHLERLRAHIDAEKEALLREEEHLNELRKEFKGLRASGVKSVPGTVEKERARDILRSAVKGVETTNRLFGRERTSPAIARLAAGSAVETPLRLKGKTLDFNATP